MKRFSRKGSMQLSIEAIIILVIAMVLLGLGIAFIQGFFKTGEQKLLEPFDAIEFGCDPTANDPITTSPTKIELKSGDQFEVKVCVYAKEHAESAIVGFESCRNTVDPSASMMPTILAASQTIQRTEVGGFTTILSANDASTGDPLEPATYICTLAAVTDSDGDFDPNRQTIGRKQVTIRVT